MNDASVHELASLLPQAAPMILLTGLGPDGTDGSAEAEVAISPDSPFFDGALDGVPACVALEYMAQAMALVVGRARRRRGLPPKVGFVLGSRRLETLVPCFRNGLRYRVRAVCTYEDESFGSFDCAVTGPDGACVAQATLTAFQPDGEMDFQEIGAR